VREHRDHRHVRVALGDAREALLELGEPLRFAARTLREEHQDLAALERRGHRREQVVVQMLALAVERHDADHVQREPGEPAIAQEIIRRGHRPHARQQAQR
jgi:hypothetical protein